MPQVGSAHRRDGTPAATHAEAGITAQRLRHLDLLLIAPLRLTLEPKGPVPVASSVTIALAEPSAFITQKLLIATGRTPDKQAADLLYIHDTIEIFSPGLEGLGRTWSHAVLPRLSAKSRATLRRAVDRVTGPVTDTHRRAATLAHARGLDPERVRAVLTAGLGSILRHRAMRQGIATGSERLFVLTMATDWDGENFGSAPLRAAAVMRDADRAPTARRSLRRRAAAAARR